MWLSLTCVTVEFLSSDGRSEVSAVIVLIRFPISLHKKNMLERLFQILESAESPHREECSLDLFQDLCSRSSILPTCLHLLQQERN